MYSHCKHKINSMETVTPLQNQSNLTGTINHKGSGKKLALSSGRTETVKKLRNITYQLNEACQQL